VPVSTDLNHVGAAILDRVALIYPDAFQALHDFRSGHAEFSDPTVMRGE
jgi:hypothetical protein